MRKYLMSKPTDKDNKGVFAISLVEAPAMESEWVALKENPIQLKAIDKKEQMLLGVALIPNKPIYRNDDNGEYLIEFTEDAVRETAYKFIRQGNQNNATVNHEIKLGKDVVNVVESWMIDDEVHDKTRIHGITEPVGSWAVKMKVNDPDLYAKAENGELKGISIEGLFDKQLVNLKTENMSKQSIAEAVKDGFAEAFKLFKNDKPETDEVKLGSAMLKDGEKEIQYEGEELVAGVSATLDGEPVPVGEHELDNGQVIVVEEAGTIAEIKAVEENDEAEDMEKEEVKKAIAEAVMNLGKQVKEDLQKEFDTKLSEVKQGYETKITELNSQITKLSETPNPSVQTKPQIDNTIELTKKGRLLQSLRN